VARSRRTGRSRFTLVLLILTSITVLTFDLRDSGPVQGLRDAGATVFSPVRSAGHAIARPFSNAWSGASGHDDLKKENERLRRQIDQLKGDRIQASVAIRENQSLKDQLHIKDTSDIQTLAARIVSGPLTSFDATLEIDQGSGDGVRKGMAVVTRAGLVGRVVRVTGGRSTIALITDPTFQFGIRLAKQGNLGIAKGQGSKGTLEVSGGISTTSGARRGDAVVTSGEQGSPFPPGVNVGIVKSTAQTADRTELILTVTPVANLRALTYVSVLLCDEDCS